MCLEWCRLKSTIFRIELIMKRSDENLENMGISAMSTFQRIDDQENHVVLPSFDIIQNETLKMLLTDCMDKI
jgi:hypothetical protein